MEVAESCVYDYARACFGKDVDVVKNDCDNISSTDSDLAACKKQVHALASRLRPVAKAVAANTCSCSKESWSQGGCNAICKESSQDRCTAS